MAPSSMVRVASSDMSEASLIVTSNLIWRMANVNANANANAVFHFQASNGIFGGKSVPGEKCCVLGNLNNCGIYQYCVLLVRLVVMGWIVVLLSSRTHSITSSRTVV